MIPVNAAGYIIGSHLWQHWPLDGSGLLLLALVMAIPTLCLLLSTLNLFLHSVVLVDLSYFAILGEYIYITSNPYSPVDLDMSLVMMWAFLYDAHCVLYLFVHALSPLFCGWGVVRC